MVTPRKSYYRQYRSIRRDNFKKLKLTRTYLCMFYPQILKEAEDYADNEMSKTVTKKIT